MDHWFEDPATGQRTRIVPLYQASGVVELLGGGTTCFVGLLDDGNVLKYPKTLGASGHGLDVEASIYEVLGPHPRVITFLGRSEHGLKLAKGTKLLQHLDAVDNISQDSRLKWARQCAEGMSFLHSRGVLHCDFQPDNLLLDGEQNIKICDFQGVCGELDGAALEPIRYSLPRSDNYLPTTNSDIFVLGSTIFRIMTGRDPYSELDDNDIERKYRQQDFPPTNFVAGAYVLKCWKQGYSCTDELVSELNAIYFEHL